MEIYSKNTHVSSHNKSWFQIPIKLVKLFGLMKKLYVIHVSAWIHYYAVCKLKVISYI